MIVAPSNRGDTSADAEPEHGWRNAAKRRMREIARHAGAPWPDFDVLFVAKRALTDASYSKVSGAVEKALRELDLGKPDAQ